LSHQTYFLLRQRNGDASLIKCFHHHFDKIILEGKEIGGVFSNIVRGFSTPVP
jgi:hypothetical protein